MILNLILLFCYIRNEHELWRNILVAGAATFVIVQKHLFNIHDTLGKFSRRQINDIFFLFFSEHRIWDFVVSCKWSQERKIYLLEINGNRIWYFMRMPSKHTTSQQLRYNVAATSRRCSDIVTTLFGRCLVVVCLLGGFLKWHWLNY